MRLSIISSLFLFPLLSLAGVRRFHARIDTRHAMGTHVCAMKIDACETAKGYIILDGSKPCSHWDPPPGILTGIFGTGNWSMDFTEPGPYQLTFQNETGPWTVGCKMMNLYTTMGQSKGWFGSSCLID